MSAPIWISNAGSLGITKELEPVNISLYVETGIFRAHFVVISGQLPPGLSLSSQGNISGYPIGKLNGLPLAVNEETVFLFTIRCINNLGQLADRSFSITVTGEDPPQPFVPIYQDRSLGEFSDGTWIDLNITAYDSDPGDTLTYTLVGGSLPNGLVLNNKAHIIGYVEPGVFIVSILRFDLDLFDSNTFDQSESSNTLTYFFDIRVSDGKIDVIANYKLVLFKGEVTLSDFDFYDTNQSLIVGQHVPVLLNREIDIATVTDERFFNYQFAGKNFDNDGTLGYEILPVLREPTIISSNINPIIGINSSIKINNITIVFSDFPTIYTIADDINVAAAYNKTLANINAEVNAGKLIIYTSEETISIENDVNTPLADMGILSGTYIRNSRDTNGLVTKDINKLLPTKLILNSDTGWLYGYIDSILTGEEQYIFYLRVFKKATEPSNIVTEVDYGCEIPFNILNGSDQPTLDSLFLDTRGTDFSNKTIVFAKQELFVSGDDGWYDSNGVVINGWTLNNEYQNQRSGIWKFVRSISKSTSVDTFIGIFIQLVDVSTIAIGMDVSGIGISAGTKVVDVNTTTKVITISKLILSSVLSGSLLTFTSDKYYLEFVSPVYQGCMVYVDKFTGSDINSYQERKVKLLYESATSFGVIGPESTVVETTTSSYLVKVNTTRGIEKDFTIHGADIVGTPHVVAIDRVNKIITMNTSQSLVASVILTFLSPQTVPHYTRNTNNPFSSLWKQRLTVTNSNNYLISWVTDPNLGTLIAGTPSKLNVVAANSVDSKISYSILPYIEQTLLVEVNNQDIFQLNSTNGVLVGMKVSTPSLSGIYGIQYSPVVLFVDSINNIVKLSSVQSLSAFTVIRFETTDLPRGLSFTKFGNFEGRVSHQNLTLVDNTVFDNENTTFDRDYIIAIRASLFLTDPIKREISVDRSFKLSVLNYKKTPSSSLYLEFLLNQSDRKILKDSIFNDKIVPDEFVYRLDDHWFGRQETYRMLLAFGIDTTTNEKLVDAISKYHHNKQYIFSELKLAKNYNNLSEVEYEVIYITPLDRFMTESGNMLVGNIDTSQITIQINSDNGYITSDDNNLLASENKIMEMYPASLPNMVNYISDKLSMSNKRFLQNWLLDENNNKISAIPLVYIKPGYGKKILYKLQQQLVPSNINALTDRYIWDDGLAINFNKQTKKYIENRITTFDNIININDVEATVDFAVDFPFYQINNANVIDLQDNGIIDGFKGELHNKLIVFFKQENYVSLDGTPIDFNQTDELVEGWVRVKPFDELVYGESYESFSVIAGFKENLADSTVEYQRAGVWKIQVDNTGLVTLEFVKVIPFINSNPYSSVYVTNGVKHGGTIISLVAPETIGVSYTVPGYFDQNAIYESVVTIFDNNTTKFFANNTDEYLEKDAGSKYVVLKNLQVANRLVSN